MLPSTTKQERELLHHAIGERKTPKGKKAKSLKDCFRNYFAAGPDSEDDLLWQGLVEKGLATLTCISWDKVCHVGQAPSTPRKVDQAPSTPRKVTDPEASFNVLVEEVSTQLKSVKDPFPQQDQSSTPNCPKKTITCADGSCVPLGVSCPSEMEASEMEASEMEARLLEPVMPTSAPPPTAQILDREKAPRSNRGRWLDMNCMESYADLERRKALRRVGFMVPGTFALSAGAGFFIIAGIYKDTSLVFNVEDKVISHYRRNLLIFGSLFTVLGVGLVLSGAVSASNMKRINLCDEGGCSLRILF